MFGLGAPELLIIFLVVLLLFGGAKLPELARGLGKAIRSFKEEAEGIKQEIEKAAEPSPPSPAEKKESPEQPAAKQS
ncbi:MAG: twin-arginine translocase TatA/TatE family subunit [Candidatus Bipolaricaulota bacterium]|nr:twin-arginine translocase TatA/TatE family subunit [Candidatus Bipolaricaulota bacterium]